MMAGKDSRNEHSIWNRDDVSGTRQSLGAGAPLGNLDAYISAVNRLPLLTHEEEQTYARQLKDNNDLDAMRPAGDVAPASGDSGLRRAGVRPAPWRP